MKASAPLHPVQVFDTSLLPHLKEYAVFYSKVCFMWNGYCAISFDAQVKMYEKKSTWPHWLFNLADGFNIYKFYDRHYFNFEKVQ